MIRFIDLFCGIGGFRLGLERSGNQKGGELESIGTGQVQRRNLSSRDNANPDSGRGKPNPQAGRGLQFGGYRCVWSCDIDKWARQIYEKNFKEEPSGDIRTVQPEEIPDAELCTFGWPCQDNSIAGKRKGQSTDTRSGLLFEAVKVLRIKKPKYFIAENVPGLLSVNEGCDFYATIRMFTDAGYDCQWQVLNTRWFLPQNRERIFFVGHLRGERRPEVFPVGQNDKDSLQGNGTESWGEVGATLSRKSASGQNARGNYVIKNRPMVIGNVYESEGQAGQIFDSGGISKSIVPAKRGGSAVMPIIPAQGSIRRLTPIECERLQGFPDNWTAGVSDTQRYKLLGNAVTVNVIKCLGERLAQGVLGLS